MTAQVTARTRRCRREAAPQARLGASSDPAHRLAKPGCDCGCGERGRAARGRSSGSSPAPGPASGGGGRRGAPLGRDSPAGAASSRALGAGRRLRAAPRRKSRATAANMAAGAADWEQPSATSSRRRCSGYHAPSPGRKGAGLWRRREDKPLPPRDAGEPQGAWPAAILK